MNYDKLSLCGAAAAIRNGEISAAELNRHCLEVAKKTAGLNAFVVIDEQYVLEQAAKTDEKSGAERMRARLREFPSASRTIWRRRFCPPPARPNLSNPIR